MLFNSLEFALFFPIAVAGYFLLSQKLRIFWLLAASCVFYMAFIPAYILILFVTIVIDYFAGIHLERVTGRRKTVLLWVSIISTCLVLFVFKYFLFFTESLIGLTGLFGLELPIPVLKIILPIGLSFHTFQSLSYVIEVYRGRQKAEPHFVTYATYVMFFPQLVAGPIERPQNLLSQLWERHEFEYGRVASGLKRMGWGFFKKLVIADRLALYVNDVYAAPQEFNGLQLTVATIFFAYQIYCDFSGYSDIAIGAARVLGFRLIENFDAPYGSRTISEFWSRWHISLSSWFRDYVYIPMGGNRVTTPRWFMNLMVTFALSGLWHGANWTYVVWGALNGFYLILGIATSGVRDRFFARLGLTRHTRIRGVLMTVSTFTLICIAWVFFRAQSLDDAWYILTHMTSDWDFSDVKTEQFLLRQMPVALASILFLEVAQYLHRHTAITPWIASLPLAPRWAIYSSFALGVVIFGVYRESQFIYFQF